MISQKLTNYQRLKMKLMD